MGGELMATVDEGAVLFDQEDREIGRDGHRLKLQTSEVSLICLMFWQGSSDTRKNITWVRAGINFKSTGIRFVKLCDSRLDFLNEA